MNAEEVKALVKEVDNELFDVVNHLICSICQELFNKPVTTPCGHSFCNGCIKRVISTKNSIGCPLCKRSLTRYSLIMDKVKSTLSLISRELPTAFKMDVENLNYGTKELAEDLIKRSKLFQLHSNDLNMEPKSNKRRVTKNKTCAVELYGEENDVDSFVPLLTHSENVKKYSNAKKKEIDDLISISQVQDGLSSSICGPSDVDKKLEEIEKIPAEEKVRQWFDAVGDNLLINSPTASEVIKKKKGPESRNFPCSRIRIDYAKATSPSCSKENEYACDPYEFIPSQNNEPCRTTFLKSGKKSKKLSQLKALQMLSNENIKRRLINKEEAAKPSDKGHCIDNTMGHKTITASQKFDKLLQEIKEEEKQDTLKGHTLYSFSQASSVKFLNSSIYSKIDCEQNKKKYAPLDSKKKLAMITEEKSSNENLYSSYFISQEKMRGSCKRKRSRETICREDNKTHLLDTCNTKTTKLMDLLKELVNDETIYNNFKTSSPKLEASKLQSKCDRVKNFKQIFLDKPFEFLSQNTQLLGFVTQEESQDVTKFKEMVTNMEEELEYEQDQFLKNTCLTTQETFADSKRRVLQTKSVPKTNDGVLENMSKDQSCKVVPFNLLGKIKKSKNYFIEFIQLGRLTPSKRRSRSCVVKLVFPIGFSSFAKHQSVPSKFEKSISVESASEDVQPFHKGIKPFEKINSEFRKKTSVEIQTSQHLKSEVQIQTSQTINKYKSIEIQTSQLPCDFAEVQTTQTYKKLSPSTSQFDVDHTCQSHEVKTIKNIQISQSDKIFTQNLKSLNDNKIGNLNNTKDIETKEKFFNDENDPTKKVKEGTCKKPNVKYRKTCESSSGDKSSDIKGRIPVGLCSQGFTGGNETKFLKESVDSLRSTVVEFDLDKISEKPCTRNTQEYFNTPVGLKNKKNTERNSKNVDEIFNYSNYQLIKKKSFLRIASADSSNSHGVVEVNGATTIVGRRSVADLETLTDSRTPKENSEDQLLRVFKNIDVDLKGKKELENTKSEKSEESDSDFFVEQTPPKPRFSNARWKDSRILTPIQTQLRNNKSGTVQLENIEKYNTESADLIGDSIPKELLGSESILLLTVPEKHSLTPKNIDRSKETSRKTETFGEPSTSFNFQKSNKLNQSFTAEDLKEKESKTQKRTFVGALKQTESNEKKKTLRKKVCVVASSIKNPELIKRFVSKFKLEYSNKLTKDMTHLIVGLHKNEENELLPLCTPKLLFAIANKKWIVSEFWAETCLKMNAVLAEEPFETLDPVGGSGCKNARLSTDNLLEKCDVCLIGEFQTISKEEFASLIVDCGGTLIADPEDFSFVSSKIRMILADRDCLSLTENEIRELYEKYSTVVLSRDVIIMSIQSYKLSNFTPYLLHEVAEEELVEKGYPFALVKSEEESYDERVTKNK